MKETRGLRLAFLAAGLAVMVGIAALPHLFAGAERPTLAVGVTGALLAGAAVAALWLVVDRLVLGQARRLVAEAPMLAHGAATLPVESFGTLAPVASAVAELAGRISAGRADLARAVAEATNRADEQSGRLAALLRDLHEGVLVCNQRHQVLLYNEQARLLLGGGSDLGLGRSLLQLVSRQPVQHTLDRLTRRVRERRHLTHADGTTARFVTGARDGRLLQSRMAIILAEGDEAAAPVITGYVVTREDATQELASLARRDGLLRTATEDVRGPLANLGAAAETLCANPDMTAEERTPFIQVIVDASAQLNRTLERITAEYRAGIQASWPMGDLWSSHLFALVAERNAGLVAAPVTQTGLPVWLHGDSYSLVLLLSHLSQRVAEATGAKRLDLSAEPDARDRFIFVDLVWEGAPLSARQLAGWRDDPLAEALSGLTVGDAIEHHQADIWSEQCDGGRARLRLPLPPPREQHGIRRVAAPRPEFFDFSLLHQPLPEAEFGKTPLKALSYVVFDTETTGLSPSQGDELVSVAGVRIVGGRILTGEVFQSLINPGRPIPAESQRIHGISDAMVADAPPAEAVLPHFRGFVGSSVLVAHNAAFDLKFLKMKSRSAGVTFDVPVLDTMILSRQIQGEDGEHSLDGLASRLGVQVVDRHSALGDSLMTAAIFLRILDLLADRGIITLDDAIRRSNMAVELHARERAF